ncbi:MAG: TIGR00730 family Rossman fold protein [Eubacterium sp.]|nr:TIGR00730 family Rossman fold protein [Candidatus Colimonas fimequi]
MNITVYLGATEGNNPQLKAKVAELGNWIGANGHRLVYGGSKVGLMGHLALAALDAGGEVIGVEPKFFIDQEVQLDEVTELIVTETMAERKTKMVELGEAFIAFPGGTGTLEEIAEIMSMQALGMIDAPCIFYNLNGYYDHMKGHLENMIKMGLSTEEKQAGIYFPTSLAEIVEILL